MKNKGLVLVWLSVVTTINLFILAKLNTGGNFTLNWLTVSQLISLLGTNLLCLTFILSCRFNWLEKLFGGLDRVYRIHHICGGFSFVMLLNHPLFLAVNVLPNISLVSKYVWFSNLLPYNFGLLALYSMLILLILTFTINLPYDLWLKTHEFMGVTLFFASIHVLTIGSDVSRFWPLRLWVVSLLLVSALSVVYKRYLYKYLGPKFNYLVDSTEIIGDVINVYLKPVTKKMNFYPGQYVFARFEKLGKETHPFSISNDGKDGLVRLSVKILGDYTLKVKGVSLGESVAIYGPYGNFFESLLNKQDLVWIAGGIGITPFLGMMEMAKNIAKQKIDLIYCAKTESELVFDNEIKNSISQNGLFRYWKFCTQNHGHLDANSILGLIGGAENKKFLLCGPNIMMKTISTQLASLGVKKRNVIFEDFNFK